MVRPRIRLFDIVGVLAVVSWVAVVGIIVYGEYFASDPPPPPGGAVFQEGESYMILTREDEEVGYIHETRTFVTETDNWLLEYDLVVNVSMLGVGQFLQTQIKATVDQGARLDNFSATIETAGTEFEITGEVEGSTVVMKMDLAGELREQRIELEEPPRLANSALNELVGNKDKLEPGMTFEQEYFDPTKMGMTKMTFEFVRERTIDVYDEKIETLHFRQKVSGTELDAYVDENGEVQLQEFPLRIVGARVPNVLGRGRALSFRREMEKKNRGSAATADAAPSLSLEAAVELATLGTLPEDVDTSTYRITQIPEGTELQLASLHQRVTSEIDGGFEIDTSERGDVALDEAPADLDTFKVASPRVDADSEKFARLLPEDPPKSITLRAEMISRNVRKRMETVPAVGNQTASVALDAGKGNSTEQSLVLVAALRHHEIAARFVSGAKLDENGEFIAHQWVQYWDGTKYWSDVDPTTETMLPGNDQIQLFTHPEPEQPALAPFLAAAKIERMTADVEPGQIDPEGVDSDFN